MHTSYTTGSGGNVSGSSGRNIIPDEAYLCMLTSVPMTDCFSVPELRIYTFFDRPVGPHPYAMFEVNLFTPAQFGAFIPWLVIWRGPLSALIHPNTDEEGYQADIELRNHTQRATWMGEKVPLDVSMFVEWGKKQREAERMAAE